MTIGILALQGSFLKHEQTLKSLNVNTLQIRKPKELESCDALIIPGGESTTLIKLIDIYNFRNAICKFAENKPIMGTCAGAILLSKNTNDDKINPLELIDIDIERNAYGRQIHSFAQNINISNIDNSKSFEAIFIRAPKINRVGESVKILAILNKEPIMVQNQNILALTFHPELTNDNRIHKYFLKKIIQRENETRSH